MTNYQVFSCLSTGYSHKDGCCQDYAAHYEEDSLRIAVVSDGHGDKSCFRSDVGSRLAVEVALALLKEFADSLRAQGWQDWLLDERGKQEKLMRQLKRSIVGAWDTRVREHLRENPLTAEELARPNRYSDLYRRGEKLTHIYGCTLIAAMAFESCLVLLHVGDGRCVVFDRTGEGCQPVPWDELCIGNVTTSMCHEDAADRCRHKVLHLEKDGVLACFVTTDGIEDSFTDLPEQSGLYAYFSDVMARTVRVGIPALVEEMREELPYISQYGSQDDTSFGAIVDMDAVKKLEGELSLAFETYKCRLEADAARKKLSSMQRKMDILRSNVADAERRVTATGAECAAAERELEEARCELEKRRQVGPGKLADKIRRLKESLTQTYQESMERLSAELTDWIRAAEENQEMCSSRQSRTQRNCEDARSKLAQARSALEDYSRLHQSYVDQHRAATEKLELLQQKARSLQQGASVCPDAAPEEEAVTPAEVPGQTLSAGEAPGAENWDIPEESQWAPSENTGWEMPENQAGEQKEDHRVPDEEEDMYF